MNDDRKPVDVVPVEPVARGVVAAPHAGPKIRVVVQVGHESPRQPGHEGSTGAAGEVEMVRKIGAALMAELRADPRFRPRLAPGKVPIDLGNDPHQSTRSSHCTATAQATKVWTASHSDSRRTRSTRSSQTRSARSSGRSTAVRDAQTTTPPTCGSTTHGTWSGLPVPRCWSSTASCPTPMSAAGSTTTSTRSPPLSTGRSWRSSGSTSLAPRRTSP